MHRTPYYQYDLGLLGDTLRAALESSGAHGIDVHYAVKANSEPRILSLIAAHGFGAECVSGNEIELALRCGFPSDAIMFDGAGKTDDEINLALRVGIRNFNIESLEELEVVDQLSSAMGVIAPVSLRINPDIDAHTLEAITTGLEENKFGISECRLDDLFELLGRCKSVRFRGLQFHVGSQITEIESVFEESCIKAARLVRLFEEKGYIVDTIDLGGGLGISYEEPDKYPVPDFERWFAVIDRCLERRPGQHVVVEPGRALVAQCGSLISHVLYVKKSLTRQFLILDAGMNDLIRPALYGSYHHIDNITAQQENRTDTSVYDVVGPICESTDVFASGRELPLSRRGDVIAIRSAGAYGATMSNRYNMHDIAEAVYVNLKD